MRSRTRLGLGLVALLWLALPASSPALPRSTLDRADDVEGAQIHVMYALPTDGTDRALDTNGTLASSVAAFNAWLAGKADGRGLRLDTYQGELDVTFFRLSETDAEIRARDPFIRDFIEDEIQAAGFTDPDKIYAVYYDGTSDWSCGGGAWPPALPGTVAALYLDGFWDKQYACRNNPFAGPGDPPTYLEFAMLHEIMHTFGFVATCAPNEWRAGHVSDDADDLMWAGDGNWVPSGWAHVKLDTGNDDYYRHANGGCLDLDDSAFLTGVRCDVSWASGVSGAWSDPTKWSTGSVPSSTQRACITAGGSYTVTLSAPAAVGALKLGAGSGAQTLALQAGVTLTVGAGYEQTAAGTFETRVQTSTSFGKLVAGGALTLDGRLSILRKKSYRPSSGTFAILAGASRNGSFDEVAGAVIQKAKYLKPTYSDTAGSLVVTTAALSLTPSRGPPGTAVRIDGSGYPANDTVPLRFKDKAGRSTNLGSVSTDAAGAFSISKSVPGNAAAGVGKFSGKSQVAAVNPKAAFDVT